jgi:hypothetical protein
MLGFLGVRIATQENVVLHDFVLLRHAFSVLCIIPNFICDLHLLLISLWTF